VTPWLHFTVVDSVWSYASISPGTSAADFPVAQSSSWSGRLVELHADGYSAWAQARPDEISSFAAGGPNLFASTALTSLGFLMSPNTSVTFFFHTDLDMAAGDAGLAAAAAKVTFGNETYAATEIDARGGEHFNGYLSASRDVYGADAVQGKLSVATYTESYTAAAPVPEPAAPAMLLGGLGLLAALGRRRAR